MQKNRGFTLLEMLIVITLILIMTSILLARTTTLTRQATLNIAAADIVSLVREARQDSISIEGVHVGGTTFFPSYGAHFDTNSSNNTTAILYADCVADDTQDTVPPVVDISDSFHFDQANCPSFSTTRRVYTLPAGIRINRIEAEYLDGTVVTTSPDEASVLFLRPEPTVWITLRESGVRKIPAAGEVRVVLRDANSGLERGIIITTNGGVAVD